jgi:uncharacterized protein (DUF1810 family)
MAAGLDRFVAAQDGCYATALAELRAGAKQSHWMWFVFPQLVGLGRSATAQVYGLADLDAARAYLAHPLLRGRLEECADAMLSWSGRRTAQAMLGAIDAKKFGRSMTLFEAAGGSPCFAAAIDAFHAGVRDSRTLALIGGR